MKFNIRYILVLSILTTFIYGCATTGSDASTTAIDNSILVKNINQQLTVSNDQAAGGAGAILSYAQDKLSTEDFSVIKKSLTETDVLIEAAPLNDVAANQPGSLGTALSANNDAASGMGVVASSFRQLGLDSNMAGKFLPIMIDYLDSKGGNKASDLLRSVF